MDRTAPSIEANDNLINSDVRANSAWEQGEKKRLDVLRSYEVLDSPNVLELDRFTRLAARLFDVPIVLISLLDAGGIRIPAQHGLEQFDNQEPLFQHLTKHGETLLVVPEATLDSRFENSPLVTGDNHFRFLASASLKTAEGVIIGAFCLIDTKPRDFSQRDRDSLLDFANLCCSEMSRYRNEKIYRSLVENGTELLSIFREDGTLVYESPSIERLGYQASDLIGESVFHLIHPDDREKVIRQFQRVVNEVDYSAFTNFRFQHKDGSYRYLESIGLNRLADKSINGIVVNARDVTERVQVENKLSESESRFKTAFDQTSLGMAPVSPEGKWLRINNAICEILGYDEHELQSIDFQSITHPEDLDSDLTLLQSTLNGEIGRYSMEKRYRHREGHYLWCELNVSLVRDYERNPLYFISQIQNITERKNQEQRLRLLESVAVNVNESVLIFDAEPIELTGPKIIYVNRAFTAMTGYEAHEVIGQTPKMFQGIQTSEETKEYMRLQMEAWKPHSAEMVNYRKDGTPYWVKASFTPISDAAGKYTHWVALEHDITQRKNDEFLLKESRQQAESANEAKSEFLSRMSHEFRTPLNAILGFAQLLQTAPLSEKDQQSVSYILHAGKHLLELVNEVLDIARIESGRLKLEIEEVRISDIAHEVLQWVQPLASEKKISIHFNAKESDILTSTLTIDADPKRLRQILLNLLSNALKFNRPAGSISLGCKEIRINEQPFVALHVSDTGYGIEPELNDLIFRPFERLSAEQEGIEGSGIGLALSKQLAQAMGGDLKFTSTRGEGSTFWIELPVSKEI